MDLFNLFAKISLDTSEYEDGLDRSEKKASNFGQKLKSGLATAGKVGAATIGAMATGTIALGTAMVKGTKELSSYGDNIDKMSQKLGLSYSAYQEWDYVLGQAGADINSMSVGLKTLTNKIDDAKNGSKDAQAMFSKLGISVKDLKNMTREEIFESAIYGFQGMADSTERAALANDLFGRSGQELTPLFNSSIEDTKALQKAAHDLGFVLSDETVRAAADYNDALDTMQRTTSGLKNSLLSNFLPGVTMVMDGLTKIFSGDESGGGVEMIKTGISDMIKNISDGLPKVLEVGGQIMSGLITAISDNLPDIISQGSAIIIELVSGIVKSLPHVVKSGIDVIITLADSLSSALPDLIPVAMQAIITIVETLLKPENIGKLLKAAVEIIGALGKGILGALTEVLKWSSSIVQKLTEGIRKKFADIKATGKAAITNVIDGVKSTFSDLVAAGGNVIENIKNGVSNAFTRFREWIGEKFETIKEKITAPFDTARDTIRGIIDRIKDLFDFEWNLPKLKMPHFSWKWEKVGDILKLPKISVDWYARAYENPIMFTSPTVVSTGGGLKGFGDRPGGEIVYGKNQLIDDIKTAFSEVLGTADRPILLYLDGNKLVGGTSKRMDKKLGDLQAYQLRWEGAR